MLFVRDDIDAIVMALPPQFHADMAVRAVLGGKDVLVEKPIALTVADAERSVKAAKDNGRVFMVGHVLRFHPAFETLKALIDNGELGEVRYIHSHRLGLGKFHTENDALWDLAPHDLSMILAITGTEPIEVRGEGAALLDHLSDFAHLHMRFPNGLRSHLFTSRLNPYRERRLTVVGTKAMAVFDDVEPWERKLAVYRHAVWQDSGQWAFTANEPSYVAVGEGHAADPRAGAFYPVHRNARRTAHRRRGSHQGAAHPDRGHGRPHRICPPRQDDLASSCSKEDRRGFYSAGTCAGRAASRVSMASASAPRSERSMKPPPNTRASLPSSE